MSASIIWRPRGGGERLEIDRPSQFIEQAESVFNTFPIILTEEDILKVETLAAINDDWGPVVVHLVFSGSIELKVEY